MSFTKHTEQLLSRKKSILPQSFSSSGRSPAWIYTSDSHLIGIVHGVFNSIHATITRLCYSDMGCSFVRSASYARTGAKAASAQPKSKCAANWILTERHATRTQDALFKRAWCKEHGYTLVSDPCHRFAL